MAIQAPRIEESVKESVKIVSFITFKDDFDVDPSAPAAALSILIL